MRRLGGSDQHPLQHLILSLIIGGLVTSCAWRYPPADMKGKHEERTHSSEQIRALLDAPMDVIAQEAPFTARATSVALGVFRLSCHVPPSWEAEFVRVVLVAPSGEVLDGKAGPADTREPLITTKAVCGSAVVCLLVTRYGDLRQTPPVPLVVPGCD